MLAITAPLAKGSLSPVHSTSLLFFLFFFSPEMVQTAPGGVEEVRRAALRKRVCQGLEGAAPIPMPAVNGGEALQSGFPWGSSVAIGFERQSNTLLFNMFYLKCT